MLEIRLQNGRDYAEHPLSTTGDTLYKINITYKNEEFDLDIRNIEIEKNGDIDEETRDFTINSMYYFYNHKNKGKEGKLVAKPIVIIT